MSHAAARCPNCFAEASGDPCWHCGWRADDRTQAPYLPVGTLFDGRYRIGQVLGHGGFGITYLGWDENLDLKLAIKEYLPRDLGVRAGPGATVSAYTGEAKMWFEHGLQRFQDEARTLAKFQQHPGIVSVYNFFRTNGTGYMVMEYVDGFTLKTHLDKNGRIPYMTARLALLPVMDALRAVHAKGLLHRDISPDNIYITRQKQVKLLDFGAARFAASEHSRSLSVILKPGFAPVEQYSSNGRQGAWTDVYALAATFYRCITGETPPDAMDRLEEDSLRQPSQLGVEIPPAAEHMLLAGLAVRAKDRPQSMETFQRVFLQEGDTTPTKETPHSAGAQSAQAWTIGNQMSVDQAAPSAAPATLASKPAPPSRTMLRSVWWVLLVAAALLLGGILLYEREPKPADGSAPLAAKAPVQREPRPQPESTDVTVPSQLPHGNLRLHEERVGTPDPSEDSPATESATWQAETTPSETIGPPLPVSSLTPPAVASDRLEKALGLTYDQRRRAQLGLTVLGFDTQGVDGNFGGNTRAAILRFQREHGLEATGYFTGAQIALLFSLAKEPLENREQEWAAAAQRGKRQEVPAQRGKLQERAPEEKIRRELEQPPRRQYGSF